MSHNHRRAFTLTEMLVVISIIGVLVSVLLPAIQHAREAARRATCAANMTQVAKAVITYDARKGFLPASRTFIAVGQPVQNWVVPILPMLDRQDLRDTIRAAGEDPTSVAGQDIAVLLCPDDADMRNSGALSYKVNGGQANQTFTDGGTVYQNSDFIANGLTVDKAFAWPIKGGHWIANLDKNSLDRVKDGTSTTIMISENLICLSLVMTIPTIQKWAVSTNEADAQVLWFSDFPSSTTPSADFVGLNQQATAAGSAPADIRRYARPASYHPGGFNLCFADGSVRFMSESTDYRVYAVLMTSDGTKVRDSGTGLANCPWQSTGDPNFPGTKF